MTSKDRICVSNNLCIDGFEFGEVLKTQDIYKNIDGFVGLSRPSSVVNLLIAYNIRITITIYYNYCF